jgi:hypothetical protein
VSGGDTAASAGTIVGGGASTWLDVHAESPAIASEKAKKRKT